MKKLHLLHNTSLDKVPEDLRSTVLPLLENNVLEWAKINNPEAYASTLKIQEDFLKNPDISGKYFKYLRRLLEIKLETQEKSFEGQEKYSSPLPDNLVKSLAIESLRALNFLSCTQISMYMSCARKYYNRYALGIKFPKTAALQFGTAVDVALNHYFEEKKEGREADKQAVYEIFYKELDKEKETVSWGAADPEKLRLQGPQIIDAYLDRFAAETHPVAVQQEIKITFGNDGLLTGAIDILEKDSIIDTKTAKDLWKDNKAKYELQPKAYSLWFFEEFGRMPKNFKYQIVCKDECNPDEKPRTQLITLELKSFELDAFQRKITEIWNDISKGLKIGKEAFPAEAAKDRPSPLCTSEWCEYASICKNRDGLRVPLKWDKAQKKHIYEDDTK